MFGKNKIQSYSRDVKKILIVILVLNIIVLFIKIVAGIMTRSLSILSDAAHSGIDAFNNIVGLFVLKFAAEPPDKEHPYGHGKFETLAAFGIVVFLAITCVEILQTSIGRLIHPVNLPLFKIGVVWILVLTLLINIFVWIYERGRGKLLKSDLLIADATHTGSDVLITLSVLGSQYFIAHGIYWIDPVVAIIIAFIIARAGYEVVTSTVPILVDEAWLDPANISKSAMKINGVKSCYDIYSRRSPSLAFIECKIKVVPKDLYTAHQIADQVEGKLREDFGDCKVTVHVEP
ncbi:MAG: cation transporter [Candidatus Melainabacteria bacterium]|nr:cation transporter [Candidatus Melainabacteria bacterium]